MAAKTILSKNQRNLLKIISHDKSICDFFYLTGGTALAEYYLQHRLSEDLDFFSEREFDAQMIFVFWKKAQKNANIKKIDLQQSFNRNLFFLHLNDGEIIKTEFTYFPFPRIEQKKKIDKLAVDSLLDIAVNKIFTVYQKPRSRDFIDLFFIIKRAREEQSRLLFRANADIKGSPPFILQKENWKIADLVKKAKSKFDWHVDQLQLGARFLQATEVKDYPRMIKKINHKIWQDFFISEAKMLKNEILSK